MFQKFIDFITQDDVTDSGKKSKFKVLKDTVEILTVTTIIGVISTTFVFKGILEPLHDASDGKDNVVTQELLGYKPLTK